MIYEVDFTGVYGRVIATKKGRLPLPGVGVAELGYGAPKQEALSIVNRWCGVPVVEDVRPEMYGGVEYPWSEERMIWLILLEDIEKTKMEVLVGQYFEDQKLEWSAGAGVEQIVGNDSNDLFKVTPKFRIGERVMVVGLYNYQEFNGQRGILVERFLR